MNTQLRSLTYQSLLDLCTEEGINASSRTEAYGCIFGRDSAITILKILRVCQKSYDLELIRICKRTLQTLIALQGATTNLESGEEPGKFIHEFRREKYDHLVNRPRPWYIYEDGTLKNYDSVDSTPLTLIAMYRYWELTGDTEFLMNSLSSIEQGLNWIITYGDKDKDLLTEYEFPVSRMHGGLVVQSWSDSHESMMNREGIMPKYPIAAVEVQGFSWLALRLWADFYQTHYPSFGQKLYAQSVAMKRRFNEIFIIEDEGLTFAAQALDGDKQLISTITANPLLTLWATYRGQEKLESIIDTKYIPSLVERAFRDDLFDPDAGIRTMSKHAATYNPGIDSYHNGSFWPMINGLIHEGLQQWNFHRQADLLQQASIKPLEYFNCPIELYIKTEDGKFEEFSSPAGQKGCRYQAWSAAAALDWLT